MKRSITLAFLVFSFSLLSSAQQLDWADAHLAGLFDRMNYWSNYCYNDPTDKKVDSLRNASGRIYDFIENIIVRFPSSMTAEFPKAKQKGLRYVSSEDNNMRVYSWQAKMEGHGPSPKSEYRDVAAYVYYGIRKYHDISNGTEGGLCTNITTIKNSDHNLIYIANFYSLKSGEKTEKLKAYQITEQALKEISVFQEGDRLPKHLWCEYTMPPVSSKYLLPGIHFNSSRSKLFVPATELQGDKSILTDRYLTYVFNGYVYVLDKDADKRVTK